MDDYWWFDIYGFRAETFSVGTSNVLVISFFPQQKDTRMLSLNSQNQYDNGAIYIKLKCFRAFNNCL